MTMRRLAGELGATQPVIYSAFPSRQALLDAVVLDGFGAIADALGDTDAAPVPRMRAYLGFAAAHPRIYEAMFSLPSGLPFGSDPPAPLLRAFAAIRDAFPGSDDTRAEVAWSTLHGLATLQASGRLPEQRMDDRLEHAHRMLTR